MLNSVYNKDLPRSCQYCVNGNVSDFSNEVLCKKRGVTNAFDSCRKYKYDPLKRMPKKTLISDNYKPEDFSL